MLDSDSDSLTELSDPEITPSPEPSSSSSTQASSSVRQISNLALQTFARCTAQKIEKIDYRKCHTRRATRAKTNCSIPYNSLHSAAS